MHTSKHKYSHKRKDKNQRISNSKVIKDRHYVYVEAGGGTIRRLCCHSCWLKTSVATRSNRIHTALNSGWYTALMIVLLAGTGQSPICPAYGQPIGVVWLWESLHHQPCSQHKDDTVFPAGARVEDEEDL